MPGREIVLERPTFEPRACRAVKLDRQQKMATSFCRAGAERPRPSDHAINRMSCSPES